ncbi:MAG: T9SS type A sorting domain-containing protein [Bacteroidota bacterium]|nr:T9SS type A sorting domain-containing protein [Bacteroidota bacterium]
MDIVQLRRPIQRTIFILTFIITTIVNFYPAKLFCQSQADTPVAGDIIFTQVGSVDPDRFEFLTLKRLDLTSIIITDNGIKEDGTIGTTEGMIKLDNDKYLTLRDVPGGTFIRFENGDDTDETDFSDRVVTFYYKAGPMLSTSGDQVIAYMGSASAPVYIAGIDFCNSGWLTTGETSSTTSYAPKTISDFYAGNMKNYRFKGSVNSDANTTREFIKDKSNWEGSNSIFEFTMKEVGNTALPVELISFTAFLSGKSVILKWATATENNNYGWEIERKSESNSWNKIGFKMGSGNSNTPKEYLFEDKHLAIGDRLSYRLKQIDNDGRSFIHSEEVSLQVLQENSFSLEQNYPNPFNGSTVISYMIAEDADVSLQVYNVTGQKVASFINKKQPKGTYSFKFDMTNVSKEISIPSGIYLYRLQAGSHFLTRKFILMK